MKKIIWCLVNEWSDFFDFHLKSKANVCCRTDILMYVINGTTKEVVPPLTLDQVFKLNSRKLTYIIGITVSTHVMIDRIIKNKWVTKWIN